MRHRATRPLVDVWRRLIHTATHRLGPGADPRPARLLAPLALVVTLGIGAYAGIDSLTGGPPPPESSVAGGSDAPGDLTEPRPQVDHPVASDTGPAAPSDSPTPSPTPSPTSEVTPSGSPAPDPGPAPRPEPSSSAAPPTPTASTEIVDDEPPVTSLSAEYPDPDEAEFSFTADVDASFACSLDGAAYTSCTSEVQYSDLSPGWHTFAVRATDAAGNVDPDPPTTRWHVEGGQSDD